MSNRTMQPVRPFILFVVATLFAGFASDGSAQNNAHPDAEPALPSNPYISFREPWRWDVNAQLFLNSGHSTRNNPRTPGRNVNEEVVSNWWAPIQLELVYPVVREGSFYWSPNRDVAVSIRLDNVNILDTKNRSRGAPDSPNNRSNAQVTQKFVQGTRAEYTHWQSGEIQGRYRQLHLKHDTHIVCANTVFNDDLARQLPWPEQWDPEVGAYLTPIVETVGEPIPDDAAETLDTLVKFWIGEDTDPKSGSQLDVAKFLTGKVIEYFTVRGQATEFPRRTTAGGRPAFEVSSNKWGGFIVRPAHVIAKEPQGSRHDLAVLLTAVLRSAGMPARTVICIDNRIDDPLLNTISLVEFAMHDPERDLTFWVPIDIDRVRLTGGRSSQFQRKWLYFGSHDELSHMIPIAYFYHPPARYVAFNLPMLYGVRTTGDQGKLPGYLIQSLLVDPTVTPATANDRRGGR